MNKTIISIAGGALLAGGFCATLLYYTDSQTERLTPVTTPPRENTPLIIERQDAKIKSGYSIKVSGEEKGFIESFDIVGVHVPDVDYCRLKVTSIGYKNGHEIARSPAANIGIRDITQYSPHPVSLELMMVTSWNKTNATAIDRLVIEFALGDNQSPQLIDKLDISITPDLFEKYVLDAERETRARQERLRQLSEQNGISSGKY